LFSCFCIDDGYVGEHSFKKHRFVIAPRQTFNLVFDFVARRVSPDYRQTPSFPCKIVLLNFSFPLRFLQKANYIRELKEQEQ
jgi:hypothetical protein